MRGVKQSKRKTQRAPNYPLDGRPRAPSVRAHRSHTPHPHHRPHHTHTHRRGSHHSPRGGEGARRKAFPLRRRRRRRRRRSLARARRSGRSAATMTELLVAGKYRLGRKLGGGSFGEIYLGTNLQTGEEVGIKLVRVDRGQPPRPRGAAPPRLRHETHTHFSPLTNTKTPPQPQPPPYRSRSRRGTRSSSTSPSCTRSCRAAVSGGGLQRSSRADAPPRLFAGRKEPALTPSPHSLQQTHQNNKTKPIQQPASPTSGGTASRASTTSW